MQPETTTNKHFEFTGTAGSYFAANLIYILLILVPIVGIAMGFNYWCGWMAKNIKVEGRTLLYKAGLGEAWVMLFVGILLTLITFGIYIFWFFPKLYRFIYGHTTYADEVTTSPAVATAPIAPTEVAAPAVPTIVPFTDVTPSAPTPPTNLVQ